MLCRTQNELCTKLVAIYILIPLPNGFPWVSGYMQYK